ncbi:HEAT repeat domain-containing protein [Pseudoclavibacter sp. AY1H1]|uniref:HEAT repeat domain-containing protein n=1 Tax=Pseudoclavibacter sp. AY1H1 TaxID=2080584 RepID=UPI000CE8AF24|nr:PBS lyase heat domain-containing protein repeat-containing protein [Pseudoclavibacter sp. AY1H1]
MAAPTWTSQLRPLAREDWPAFLEENSGLPGPRANLSLASAVASTADALTIELLLRDRSEYTAMCAAAALSYGSSEPEFEARARTLATDERWRVREGVAIGLQLLGDEHPEALVRIVQDWADDPHPLRQRAAIAAICEPRLLKNPQVADAALTACEHVTEQYAALSGARRRNADARTLRQALGYCWSIAVAASPTTGLTAFLALDPADRDIAWIVSQNRRKKRLSALL